MTSLSPIGVLFLLVTLPSMFLLPRQWAAVPLLICVCYMTLSQGLAIGPFNFFSIRLVILAGIVRVVIRGEGPSNGFNGMDWVVVAWAGWAVTSSLFHSPPMDALTRHLGLVFNICGVYFLLRTFLRSLKEAVRLSAVIIFMLAPVAAAMLIEKTASYNLFSVLGGVAEVSSIRDGKLRAQGPFAHSILAGTVGGVCLPLAFGLWHHYRKIAVLGFVVCITMVIASTSSGPVLTAATGVGAVMMWPARRWMRVFRWSLVLGYISLDVVMKAPAYYLIGRIDVTGSSTGFHRAQLINSAIRHLDEWWFAGTDYTRHWMVTGVSWSPNHTDITNQYLKFGVVGGLPLMFLFILMLAMGYSYTGRLLRRAHDPKMRFFAWTLGASLFAHTITMIGVSYFDQSFLFLYLLLAAIGSARHARGGLR